jgi:NAD(P)-dependent dehydrogenase (short-subunit alcohol dehydrogenase family)
MASVVNKAGLLAGKVSIITGASSGLGRAMALAFAKQGASIVCADKTPASRGAEGPLTHEMIREQGGKATFVQTDVTEEKDMMKLVSEAAKQFGRLDM